MCRKNSGGVLDLVDAAALLFRFELAGVDVGARWPGVNDLWFPHADNHITAFNDTHIAMAMLGSGVEQLKVGAWLRNLEDYQEGTVETNQRISRTVGTNLVKAVVDFKQGNYSRAVTVHLCCSFFEFLFRFTDDNILLWLQSIFPSRYDIQRVGGSHAQRDIYNQLLIQAAIRSGEPHHLALARSLLNERLALKPSSGLTKRFFDQLAIAQEHKR